MSAFLFPQQSGVLSTEWPERFKIITMNLGEKNLAVLVFLRVGGIDHWPLSQCFLSEAPTRLTKLSAQFTSGVVFYHITGILPYTGATSCYPHSTCA